MDPDLRVAALRACTIMQWFDTEMGPPSHMDFSDTDIQPGDISDTVGEVHGGGMGGDLTEFVTLRSLNLSKTSLASHPLGPRSLGELKQLEKLELRDCNLNDKGLSTLLTMSIYGNK